jgi:myosin heavy chain 9/10/11/14
MLTISPSYHLTVELREAVETYKNKAESYLGRLEAAEIAKVKSSRAEAFGASLDSSSVSHLNLHSLSARRSLADAEKTHAETLGDLKAAEHHLQAVEQHVRDLEAKLEDENREVGDMELFKRRLTEEMEDERDQYQKDLAERDFTIDQTRKKYQSMFNCIFECIISHVATAELAQLSEGSWPMILLVIVTSLNSVQNFNSSETA